MAALLDIDDAMHKLVLRNLVGKTSPENKKVVVITAIEKNLPAIAKHIPIISLPR